MIVGLFMEMLSAGGVQRVSRHVAAVTANLAAERGFAFQSAPFGRNRRHDAVQRVWRDFRIAHRSRDRNDAPLPKIWTPASLRAHERERWRRQMSSPEELTFVVGRWLRPIVVVLDVVRRLGLRTTSSREQRSTAPNK